MHPHRKPFLASLILALAIMGQWALYAHHYQHDLQGNHADCPICLHAHAGTNYLHSGIVQSPVAKPLAAILPPPGLISRATIVLGFHARAPPVQLD